MKIRKEAFYIRGSRIGGENPLPCFRQRRPSEYQTEDGFPEELKKELGTVTKVLPYLKQDRYTRETEELELVSFVLENEYLSVRVLPELGGRVHSIYDKKKKRELLFTNPVIRPGNLAIRDAWLSGGIEWNIGNFGHTYTTCQSVFAAVLDDGEGNDFLRIYEFERNKSIFWQVDLHLPEGSERLISHVRLENPFSERTTTYWWTNIAVENDGETRVLASHKDVISFVGGKCGYEKLPYIKAMPDCDATYPSNASRAFDYFIQCDDKNASTWEAACYKDGTVFYERSTAPLLYKKLFCWGTHSAGVHWQEFLSDGEGTGYYAEIQAGIAPSQLHDMPFEKNSTLEWTQCFGGVSLDKARLYDEDYDRAVEYFNKNIEERISESDINALDGKLAALARVPVKENDILHTGTGFGALEVMRMELDKDGVLPQGFCFPDSTVGEAEEPWRALLQTGRFPISRPDEVLMSYNVSKKWKSRIADAAKDTDDWFASYQLGVLLYEEHDVSVTARLSFDEEKENEAYRAAFSAFEASAERGGGFYPYRNLAVLCSERGDGEGAEKYYDLAMEQKGATNDFEPANEYIGYLTRRGRYEKAKALYGTLPDRLKAHDRIAINVAICSEKLGDLDYLEDFFKKEHSAIREGETVLTDIWFEYSALKLARERGLDAKDPEIMQGLIEEAKELCPPDKSIDFRMSVKKDEKYRIS